MKLLTSSFTLLCLALVAPGWARAESILDFNMSAPTTGVISYAGGSASMIGTGIQVDNVVGLGTPVNNFVLRNCIACALNFTTGSLNQAGPTGWLFNGGGSLTVSGTVDLNNNGSVDGSDATGTLLTGYFGSAQVLMQGTLLKIAASSFTSLLSTTLTNFYGTAPQPLTYGGGFNLSFISLNVPPGAFTSLALASGDIVAATPEPMPIALLGTVLLAWGIIGRRKLRKG
jgi:hypothetical protein